MIDQATPVTEELFEDETTGLEVEHLSDGADEHEPWNPDDIRVTTKSFSLRNVLDMIDEKSLELAPDFQRSRVWRPHQRSRLIESILLQIPLPAFYFAEDADGTLRVVDGQQRLSTVWDFARGEGRDRFHLAGLEYLKDQHDDQGFDDLEPALQRRLHNTQIVVHVIAPTTPAEVMYNIFKRINTGGTPLTPQEIRHCMSKGRSREFLRQCAATPEFEAATAGSLRSHLRMGDREVVLRFCAFRLFDLEAYREADSMDAFLLAATAQLDDPRRVGEEDLDTLAGDFRRAMVNALEVFGEHTFRKYRPGQDGRNPISRPLFESWSVALADYSPEEVRSRRDAVRAAADGLATDPDFLDAITVGTGDPRRVEYRHRQARAAARAS